MKVGVSPNLYLRAREEIDVYPSTGGWIKGIENTRKSNDFSKIAISGLLGSGMEYKLNKTNNIAIKPEYRHYYTFVPVTYAIKNYIETGGLNCGISYNFWRKEIIISYLNNNANLPDLEMAYRKYSHL